MQLPLIYYFTVWECVIEVKTAFVVFVIQNHAREAAGCCLDDLIDLYLQNAIHCSKCNAVFVSLNPAVSWMDSLLYIIRASGIWVCLFTAIVLQGTSGPISDVYRELGAVPRAPQLRSSYK